MKKQLTLTALAVIIFYFGSGAVFGDNGPAESGLLEWFETARNAGSYREIRQELLHLFREADEAGIPADLLLGKIKEGAAKGVPASRLLSAVRTEKERLQEGLDIIISAGFDPGENRNGLKGHLKLISIILREGIAEEVLLELLRETRMRGLGISEGISACSAVFQVWKIASFSGEDLVRLGKALFDSSLPSSKYTSVSSVFLKAQVNRISDRDILEIVLRIFKDGGGLIHLEREISRRGRR